jgi:hypothetical protein
MFFTEKILGWKLGMNDDERLLTLEGTQRGLSRQHINHGWWITSG